MLGDYRRHVLSNGLPVLGVENAALHSFVLSVYVRVGPRFESNGQIGLTHLLEHMLLQGSVNYPTSSAIMRGVEDLGGIVDARTYPEYASVVFGVHRKHWRRVVDIACDVVLRPLFEQAEVEQEKRIIAQELHQHRDKAGRNISASELAHCLIFKDRVDEAGTRGSRQLLGRLDRRALLEHYRRFFVPSNMVVCLAGGLDFDEAVAVLEEGFDAMEPGGSRPELMPPQDPPVTGNRVLYRTTEALPVSEVLLCHWAYPLGDERFDASRAAAHLLGGGLSSRLFSRVREDLGLVYDVESHVQGYSDAGAINVFLSVGSDNLAEAVAATLAVTRHAAEEGFYEEELVRYKEGARCGMEMLCDQPSQLAEWFGKHELLLGPDGVTTPQQYVQRQEALGVDDLRQVMGETVLGRSACLVVVGPYGHEETAALRRLFPAEEVHVGAGPAEVG